MPLAIDTVAYFATAGAASPFPTTLATAPGDPPAVRNFSDPATAAMVAAMFNGGGGQKFRLTSPLLHDPNTGLTFLPTENPAFYQLGRELGVRLTRGDILTVQGGIAAAGTIVAGLVNYYTDAPGVSARLHMWPDISGIIKYIKSVEVDLGAVAVGAWTDTLLTATENQLHAHSDYAILGWEVNQAIDIVAVKGQATGNLRAGGPGLTANIDQTDYFVRNSVLRQIPFIPVFNADDRAAFYVSAFNHAAIAANAATVSLIVAELTQPVTP